MRRLLRLVLAAVVLFGCDRLAAADLQLDPVRRDLAYGGAAWQRLDIYYPDFPAAEPTPVIVFIYGGRWSSGSKSQYGFLADRFARLGYAVAIPDYVKYPQAVFPAFVEDVATAIAWLHREAIPLGLDADRLFVLAHSAGAHIGALVATDPRYLRAAGGDRSWIAAFAGLAGPYELAPVAPDLVAIFGPPARFPEIKVTTFVDGRQPPMLLLHGGADRDVGLHHQQQLEAAIGTTGGIVETAVYPGVGHLGIIGAPSADDGAAPVAEDIDRFFRRISGL